jgi:hypothetical protein
MAQYPPGIDLRQCSGSRSRGAVEKILLLIPKSVAPCKNETEVSEDKYGLAAPGLERR